MSQIVLYLFHSVVRFLDGIPVQAGSLARLQKREGAGVLCIQPIYLGILSFLLVSGIGVNSQYHVKTIKFINDCHSVYDRSVCYVSLSVLAYQKICYKVGFTLDSNH